MHLIPRRATRRVLVLLITMGSLLAVPAFASAYNDLSLAKAVDHAAAAPGDLLTYTIHIQSQGTHASRAGTVTDALPAHTTFVSASSGCTAAGGLVTCPLAPVAVGVTVSITVTVRVDPDVPAGNLVNMADVSAPGDRTTTNNHGEATTTVALAGLGDYVWWDQNHDGVQTPGEPAFGGVTVHLYHGAALAGTTTTDAAGYYRFDRLRPNTTYGVCLDAPADSAPGGPLAGFELTGANAGADDALDSDAALLNGAPCIAPAATGPAGSFVPTYDFGFWKPAAIGDRVWQDANHNGIQNAGEPGVGGVGVALKNASGATIAHAVTDANGLYLFDRLPAGTYQVCFEVGTIPSGYVITTKDASGSTRANGSDAGTDGCAVSTALTPGQRDLDWDAGIWKSPPSPSSGGSSGTVSGKPKLSLTKGGTPASVAAGGSVRYTFVVKNIGKATAHDVRVCDTLPAGVTVTSTGGGKLSAGVVCWTVGTLAKSRRKQFTLVVKVDLTQRTRIQNTAVATASDAPRARAATSTYVTLPRSRSGVAGVTG